MAVKKKESENLDRSWIDEINKIISGAPEQSFIKPLPGTPPPTYALDVSFASEEGFVT